MSYGSEFAAAWLGAMRSEPKLPFGEWAERYIRNPDGSPFRLRPYQRVPAADMFDPRVASIALRWFSGGGKTYLLSAGYCYGVEQLKLQFGKMFPAEHQTKSWLEDKLMPILRETPITSRLPMVRDNLLERKWENGAQISGRGANSGGGIRTLEIDVADADEIDAITQDKSDEGDKLAAFLKRTRGRRRQHHWMSSYPSAVGRSKIDAKLSISDSCRWQFDCPRCGESVAWHTDHVVGEGEAECPECAGLFDDAERRESCLVTGDWYNRDGELVRPGDLPSERYGRRRGLHLNCMAHIGDHATKYRDYLHEIAAARQECEAADNPKKARRVFVNTWDAESWEEEYDEKADPGALMDGRQDYDPNDLLPDEVTRLFCGVDVNAKFVAAQVLGFGESKVFGIHYEEIHGRWDQSSTWARLSDLLRHTWRHPLGVDLRIKKMFIDSRYKKETVQRWARSKGARVLSVMGSPKKVAPALSAVKRDSKTKAKYMIVGSSELKDIVYDWLSPDVETKFEMVFTRALRDGIEMFGDEYFAGLTAEERETEIVHGHPVPVFVHPDGAPRNEPLDTAAYAVGAWRDDPQTEAAARAALERQAEGEKRLAEAGGKKRAQRGGSRYLGAGGGSYL